MGANKGDEMGEKLKLGDRIKRLRGELTQAAFADLVGAGQTSVSEWELGNAEPSAAISFRLAALSHDPEDSMTFLKQAGLEPDAVVSVADMLLKKGEVKMDAILATAEDKLKDRIGDQKELADKGKMVLVPPFTEGKWGVQRSLPEKPVDAEDVPNKASTYYVVAGSPAVYQAAGLGVAPGDIVVFDRSGASEGFRGFLGEEVVAEFGDGLAVGRVGDIAVGPKLRYTVLGPSDVPPQGWNLMMLHHPTRCLMIESNEMDFHAAQRPQIAPVQGVGRLLGRFRQRISTGTHDYWRKQMGGRS